MNIHTIKHTVRFDMTKDEIIQDIIDEVDDLGYDIEDEKIKEVIEDNIESFNNTFVKYINGDEIEIGESYDPEEYYEEDVMNWTESNAGYFDDMEDVGD